MRKYKFFKCKLISDVVLNTALATEGNMTTLDYIPGSNFLGIVANAIYPLYKGKEEEVFHLFHTDTISYGDGIITDSNIGKYYSIPLAYFTDKDEKDDNTYLHYLIDTKVGIVNEEGKKVQLKQNRSGYMNSDGKIIKGIKKTFALKSAQDRETRTSKEKAMFGFESLKANQEFIFSIGYAKDEDIDLVSKYLIGDKHIGKSKSAEYGKVNITEIDTPNSISNFLTKGYTVVYAESNLSFIDEKTGQTTLEPIASQLGIVGGEIEWDKSSIRTTSYSPWNYKRGTSSMTRHCIAKGSVFCIKNTNPQEEIQKSVGEFQSEGLGRILINPKFLEGDITKWILNFDIKKDENDLESPEKIHPNYEEIHSAIGKTLLSFYKNNEAEKVISKNVIAALNSSVRDLKANITSSQWGNIRALATDYHKDRKTFSSFLEALGYDENQNGSIVTNQTGMLTHGKMFEKMWDKEGRLEKLKTIVDKHGNENLIFVAKYAAEMAKEYIELKKK